MIKGNLGMNLSIPMLILPSTVASE